VDDERAAGGKLLAEEELDEGGFAGAAGAYDEDEFPFADVDGDVGEGNGAVAVGLGYPDHMYHGCHFPLLPGLLLRIEADC
jgi:hypothetical protein